MKRAILILGLSVAHCIGAAALTDEQIRSWESVLARSEFTNTLYALAHETSWPAVYSPQHAAKLGGIEKKTQQLFRDLSGRLAVGLQHYAPRMKEMPLPNFASSADLLLDARDRLSNKSSYINMVLVDSINRVLFYNLALRLSAQNVDLPQLSPLVERLRQDKLAMDNFLDVISAELGKPLLSEFSVATMQDVEIYQKLWHVLQGDAPLFFPREIQNVGALTLLKNRDAGLLLWRLALTDYQINTILPGLVEYRQKVENYSIDDDYQKIKRTIGQELKHPSLGARVAGVTLAGEGVARLLYLVRKASYRNNFCLKSKASQRVDASGAHDRGHWSQPPARCVK